MKCSKCGNEILPGQAFCTTCGTPVSQMQNEVKKEPKKEVRNQNLGPDFTPPKKRAGMPVWAILLILTLVIVIIVGICFIVITLVDADDDSSSSKKKHTENEVSNSITNDITNDITNNVNPNNKDKNKKIISVNDGFVAKIPNNYKYKMSTDGVSISDSAETMLINLQIKEYPYSTIVAKKDELASKMREGGATVNKMEEKMVNGAQCFIYEVNVTGYNSIIALVRIDGSNTALVEVIDADYTTFNYNHLEKAVEIAVTAEKSTDSTTSTSDGNNTITNLESKSSIDYGSLLDE